MNIKQAYKEWVWRGGPEAIISFILFTIWGIITLAAYLGVAYVIVHFIIKYW